MKLTIGHLYPDLLNLYADRGNITTLKMRMEKRGIEVLIKNIEIDDEIDFDDLDIVVIGGGSDREQLLVCSKLKKYKKELKNYVENNGVLLAVCGGYQLLGNYFKINDREVTGLEILDIYTERKPGRLIGNIILESGFLATTVVGFENHGGRTYIGNHAPLGKVKYGFGNNGEDGLEGVVYKNVIATYLHGPLLPKNPYLADYIIKKALEKKGEMQNLASLNDTFEITAHNYILNRFLK